MDSADQSRAAEISNFYCLDQDLARKMKTEWEIKTEEGDGGDVGVGGFHHLQHPGLRNMIDVRTKVEQPVVKF